MDVEIFILGQNKFTLNDVISITEQNDRVEAILRGWEDDHQDLPELIYVPDFWTDPEGYREAMDKIAARNQPDVPRPPIKVEFDSGYYADGRISWQEIG